MNPLELKKLRVELLRVQAAKGELELRVDERLEEITRLREHIQISEKKEHELMQKLKEIKAGE